MLVLLSMILGERVSAVKWGWLLLAFSGVVILLSSELTPTHGDNLVTGIALALCAAFFYALTAIIARKLQSLPAQHIAFYSGYRRYGNAFCRWFMPPSLTAILPGAIC